jgi:hypothetical protein
MENLSDLNEYKKTIIVSKLNEISRIGFAIIDKLEDKTFNVDILIYRDFFERFIFCFDNVSTLLNEFDSNTYSKDFAIALNLRTSLVDFLNVIYLTLYFLEDNPIVDSKVNYKSELGKTLCSHLKRVLDRFNMEYLKGDFKEGEYKQLVERFYKQYFFLFNHDEEFNIKEPSKTLIYKHEITNQTIVKKLISHSDIHIKNYARAIALFEIYSKYEHYGILSRRFQRISVNERFKNIIDSLELLIDGAWASFNFFRNVTDIKREEDDFIRMGGLLKGIIIKK